MQVSLDGGVTWVKSDNVRVIYDNVGEDEDQSLLVNLSEEGAVLDVMDADGEVEKSAWMMVSDMEDMTH